MSLLLIVAWWQKTLTPAGMPIGSLEGTVVRAHSGAVTQMVWSSAGLSRAVDETGPDQVVQQLAAGSPASLEPSALQSGG